MRQWRVGSFSMGLILVLLGVGLILNQFSGTPKALELVANWWPLALILLGAEILASGFLSRNEQFKIKYDGWSILLTIILVFFCLGSYALFYSGIMLQIRETLSLTEHSCTIPDQETNLTGINKIVISSQEGDLELHSISGNKLTVLGQATIQASTAEQAAELARQAQAEIKTVGDTLFIRTNQVPERNNIFRSNYSKSARAIFVPADIQLEVTRPYTGSNTILNLDSLAAPWSVDSGGPVRINLAPDLDLTLSGSVTWSRKNLTGNADWVYTSEEDPDNGPHQKVSGKIKLGQGRWPLVISSEQSIEANLRPVQ